MTDQTGALLLGSVITSPALDGAFRSYDFLPPPTSRGPNLSFGSRPVPQTLVSPSLHDIINQDRTAAENKLGLKWKPVPALPHEMRRRYCYVVVGVGHFSNIGEGVARLVELCDRGMRAEHALDWPLGGIVTNIFMLQSSIEKHPGTIIYGKMLFKPTSGNFYWGDGQKPKIPNTAGGPPSPVP